MENLAYKQEILRQMLFISSILAGFAFTVVVQLLNREGRTKVVLWSAITFIASTMSLLIATVGGAVLLFASNVLLLRATPEMVDATNGLFAFLGIFFIIGLMTFIIGIAIVGWLQSKTLGIIAVILSILSCMIMSGFYIVVALTYAPK
jgi:hypothetical protein